MQAGEQRAREGARPFRTPPRGQNRIMCLTPPHLPHSPMVHQESNRRVPGRFNFAGDCISSFFDHRSSGWGEGHDSGQIPAPELAPHPLGRRGVPGLPAPARRHSRPRRRFSHMVPLLRCAPRGRGRMRKARQSQKQPTLPETSNDARAYKWFGPQGPYFQQPAHMRRGRVLNLPSPVILCGPARPHRKARR